MNEVDDLEFLQHQLDRQRRSMFKSIRFNEARKRSLAAELLSLNAQLEELQATVDDLRAIVAHLGSTNQKLQDEIKAMEQSSSWQMTRPLRTVVRIVRDARS